jgi:3-deoxy-D-manno-octulosonic acid hydroxylase-like protein
VPDVSTLRIDTWTPAGEAARAGAMHTPAARLESGEVLFFPHLAFAVGPDEARLFTPAILASAKNASFDPATGRAGGTTLQGGDLSRLAGLMRRFSDAADTLVNGLLVPYRGRIERARASFRPAEIAGRASSWRKDDTRLHVDSFPATPVQGRRILRLFTNVNPAGRPRTWRIGGGFEDIANRFAGSLSMPWPGSASLLRVLHVTKSTRSPYDALMLQLHDRMKKDEEFQKTTPQVVFEFPAGSTWLTFTDAVPHAAMAGQYQLEQTFLLPVSAMIDEQRSPLRILERLKGRSLV